MGVKFLAQHPIVGVKSIAATEKFYNEVLGFQTAFKHSDFYAALGRDGVEIHFNSGREEASITHVYFVIDDVDAYYADVLSRGGVPDAPPELYPYGMKEFYIKDPDGNVMGFGQRIHYGEAD